jgi:hypothetical protein
MSAATIFTFVKTAWPVISFALSMLSALHASSVHAASVDGSVSVQDQLVHVIGGGSASLITFLAGTVGMFTNHRAAEAAPAKAPEGIDPVLHQLSVAHSIMLQTGTTDSELDELNNLVKARRKPK